MKLLKVEGSQGSFLNKKGEFVSLEKITKEDLLWLVNKTLDDEVVEFDDYDENLVRNEAHRIIYKSVSEKLRGLRARRKEFVDDAARLYLEDYERYRADSGEKS